MKLAPHISSFSYEMCTIVVTLLELLSRLNKGSDRVLSEETSQNQMAIMLSSLAITLMVFVLTLVGSGNALAGLKVCAWMPMPSWDEIWSSDQTEFSGTLQV